MSSDESSSSSAEARRKRKLEKKERKAAKKKKEGKKRAKKAAAAAPVVFVPIIRPPALPPRRFGHWSVWRLSLGDGGCGSSLRKWNAYATELEASRVLAEREARVRAFERLSGRRADGAAGERWAMLHWLDRIWICKRQSRTLHADAAAICEEVRELCLTERAAREWYAAASADRLPAEREEEQQEAIDENTVRYGSQRVQRVTLPNGQTRDVYSTIPPADAQAPPPPDGKKRRPSRYNYFVTPCLAAELRVPDDVKYLVDESPHVRMRLLTLGPCANLEEEELEAAAALEMSSA